MRIAKKVGGKGRIVKTLQCAATLVLALPLTTNAAAAENLRPNFVIIMADDLGYGDISCFSGWIETPHLDALAARGMRFTDFHSSGNVCSPTRAGLLTGRYQQRAGIPGVVFADAKRPSHQHGLQPSEITFAELLHDAGYATALIGKWHLGYLPKFNPMLCGFDLFHGFVSGNVDYFSHVDQTGRYDWWHNDKLIQEPGYSTHLITEHAVDFIAQNHGQPFCLYVAHEAPHYPYQGPNDKSVRAVGGSVNRLGERTDTKQAYREMVVEMDHGIGQIVAVLDKHDIADNTLVFFCSDNGATRLGSNGNLRGFKGRNWEGGHRVPAIATWPSDIPPGTTTDALTITLDIMPTLLATANVPPPEGHQLDGVSLLDILSDKPFTDDRKLYWNGKAMRHGKWKLIRHGNPERIALFDLSTDIGEQHNLANNHPERVQKMLTELEAWTKDVTTNATAQP